MGMGPASSSHPSCPTGRVPEDGQPWAALALLRAVGWGESLVLPRTCPALVCAKLVSSQVVAALGQAAGTHPAPAQ